MRIIGKKSIAWLTKHVWLLPHISEPEDHHLLVAPRVLLIRREVSQVEGYVMLESVMSDALSDVSIWGCKDEDCEDCY